MQTVFGAEDVHGGFGIHRKLADVCRVAVFDLVKLQIFNGVFSVLILQCQPHAFRIALEIFKEVQKVVQVETQQRHALVALIHPRARVSDVASAGPVSQAVVKPLVHHVFLDCEHGGVCRAVAWEVFEHLVPFPNVGQVEIRVEVIQHHFQRVRAHEIHQSHVIHGDAEWIEFGVDFQVWDSEGGRAGIVRLNHLQRVAVLF